jgi:CheY-like chemotaxis protein
MVRAHRVLVLDDDPSICDVVASILVDDGYEVRTSTDARKALALLQQWPPT